jgi:NTP pyrophosphatase (non-canonical NTP hydrolase)
MTLIDEILQERKRQDLRWGQQNHGPEFWLLILLEEIGEAARAVLEGQVDGYKKELTQVAAVSIAAIESLARGNLNLDSIVRLQKEILALRNQMVENRTRIPNQKEIICPKPGRRRSRKRI